MFELNKKMLQKRGVSIESIAEISYMQQSKYSDNVSRAICIESVEKILFHFKRCFIPSCSISC